MDHSSPNSQGGAIRNSGNLTLILSSVSGSEAASGGAICNLGTMEVRDSKLSNNQAENAGAIYNIGTLRMEGLTILSNRATLGFGGALYNAGELGVAKSTFAFNAADGGNAPHAQPDGRGAGGGGAGLGGALYLEKGGASLTNCTFWQNRSTGGTGGAADSAQSAGEGAGNAAGASFGGIAGYGGGGGGGISGSLTLGSGGPGGAGGFGGGGGGGAGGLSARSSGTIGSGGFGGAGGYGGGKGGTGGAGSAFWDGVGSGGGGGGGGGMGGAVFVFGGDVTVVNCTIAGNTAWGGAGGVGAGGASPGATGEGYGGGVFNYGGFVHLLNTIVGGNGAATGSGDFAGFVLSAGFNLISDPDGTIGLVSTDLQKVSSGLSPLQDNGGPTPTCSLQTGCPAMGKGTSMGAPSTDQRGVFRPWNQIDIGAYQNATASVPIINWATPADIVFGTALGASQLNAQAGAEGTFAYTPAAGTVLPVGLHQMLTVSFTPADLTRYTANTRTVFIDVLKADQSIAFSPLSNLRVGDPPVLLDASASSGLPVVFSVISGDATLSGHLLTLGSQPGPIVVRAFQQGDNNYNSVSLDQTFELRSILPPVLTGQPMSQTVNRGEPVTLAVSATSGPLSFQWRLDGVPLPGEIRSSLILPRVNSALAGSYDVVASNSSGSVTSAVAQVTVLVPAGSPDIASQPACQNVRAGEGATLSVVAAPGNPTLSYQWYQGSSGDVSNPIPGAIGPVYRALNLTHSASVWVNVSNEFGTIDSNTAVVTVFPSNAARLRLQALAGQTGLTIDGVVGTTYRIQYATSLKQPAWVPLIDLSLPTTPFTFLDSGASGQPARYYRVVIP